MISADTSTIKVGYVLESTEGTTPSGSPAPVFTPIRVTSCHFQPEISNVESDEITPDGNVADIVDVAVGCKGTIGFEMIYGNLDDLLAYLLRGAWDTNVLKNGTTNNSVTIQEYVKVDGAANDSYWLYTGIVPTKLSLSMPNRDKITGSMDFIGMVPSVSDTVTGTWGTDNTNAVMDTSNDWEVTGFLGMSPLPTFHSLELEIDCGAREKPACGSKYSQGTGRGRVKVSGKISAYVENKALFEKALDQEFGVLELTIGSETGKKYEISIPKAKITTADKSAGGNEQDYFFSGDLQAKKDATLEATIEITRAVA
jgi:hypothetical protein